MMQTLSTANQLVLTEGGMDWGKLQSAFGLVRALGGGETLAWIVQGGLAIATALVWLWRSDAPFELKAAALAIGTVLVSPYAFAYDLVLLAMPVAFLLRYALGHGFLRFEGWALAAVGALLVIYIVTNTQVGLAASIILAPMVARRVRDARSGSLACR